MSSTGSAWRPRRPWGTGCQTNSSTSRRRHPKASHRTHGNEWRKAVHGQIRPIYARGFDYELSEVQQLPEIHHLGELDASAREALSDLVLASVEHWPDGWDSCTITKTAGRAWSTRIPSPLKHWLTTLPWLDDGPNDPRSLAERWLVPESLLWGQDGRFSHLVPLSLPLARRLGDSPQLREALERLGLNTYPTEDDRTGPKLLEALARAWRVGAMPVGGFDVFLGQVRHAWEHLDPALGLPDHFLVRTKSRAFEVREGDAVAASYLPDDDARTRSLREHAKPILEMRPGRRGAGIVGKRLEAMGVRRASSLEERCVIDERPDIDIAADAVSFGGAGLEWLPAVLLTLYAHGGGTPRGPATKAWREAAAALGHALVRRCHTVSVELVDVGEVVASSTPRAHWHSQDSVLLVQQDVNFSYEELSSAAQAILNRQDLLKDLRLVLGALTGHPHPTEKRIERALDRAEIDAEAFADIRHRWVGARAVVLDRIRPLVNLFGIADDGLEAASKASRDALTRWLSSRVAEDWPTDWPAAELVSAAGTSLDDYEMGLRAWRLLGDEAQLPRWNDALLELGDRYDTVDNKRATEQTERHVADATLLLRSLACRIAVVHESPDLFPMLESVTRDFKPPGDWATRWWEVPFSSVLHAMRDAYREALAPRDVPDLQVLDRATTPTELRSAFEQQEVSMSDPYDTARQNRDGLRKTTRSLLDIYNAWLLKSDSSSTALARARDVPIDDDPSACLDNWTDAELLERALRGIDEDPSACLHDYTKDHAEEMEEFVKSCRGCSSLDKVLERLSLSPEDLEGRTEETARGRTGASQARPHRRCCRGTVRNGAFCRVQRFARTDRAATPTGRAVREQGRVHNVGRDVPAAASRRSEARERWRKDIATVPVASPSRSDRDRRRDACLPLLAGELRRERCDAGCVGVGVPTQGPASGQGRDGPDERQPWLRLPIRVRRHHLVRGGQSDHRRRHRLRSLGWRGRRRHPAGARTEDALADPARQKCAFEATGVRLAPQSLRAGIRQVFPIG